MTDPEDDDTFDFEAECIKVYRGAKSDTVKLKALEMMSKLLPAKPPVKPQDVGNTASPAAIRAQNRMNGGAE
tara:strand:+ start:32022 stop:32237 length:216 start_codon:yes stop_codon:yes gene_type:complete